ncbi:putative T7SS-secreted protein [Cellulomonas sp. CW35]|uniref:putative T7SS-secreted protein n=1 Tax=Cellulomonas sp. CW35 TaxID=3458249 RepID=UPI0040347956
MSELATATCGADLIAGDPGALRLDAVTLEARGRLYGRIAGMRIDTSWEGEAADRFRGQLGVTVRKAEVAEAIAHGAAAALRVYAEVLEWAREQAEGALALWRSGDYCIPPTGTGLDRTTLTPEQVSAQAALDSVRASVRAAARDTAKALNAAADEGPDGLFAEWWKPFVSTVSGPPDNPWHWDQYSGARGIAEAVLIPPLGPGVRPVPRVQLGEAATKQYRNTFFDAHPELKPRGDYWVHHAIEQRVLRRYPGLFTEAEMHSLGNLRGVHTSVNREIHLRQIRRMWDRFYAEHPVGSGVTRQDFLDYAQYVDQQLGSNFTPPVVP